MHEGNQDPGVNPTPKWQGRAAHLERSNSFQLFFLYTLMLSAVTLPGALTVRVTTTHLRYFTIEGHLDLQALRKPVNRNLTPEQYFTTTGEMASGNLAMCAASVTASLDGGHDCSSVLSASVVKCFPRAKEMTSQEHPFQPPLLQSTKCSDGMPFSHFFQGYESDPLMCP
jgi:hypothetical protein